jgi:16S rRNA (cytosine967-C5)-methyltransferase
VSVTPVREAAARALLAVERGRTTLAAEVERARRMTPDDRDRALLLELTAGTLRWQGELDARLAAAGRRAGADLEARVRAVLRLGAYQLAHLSRIPPHAVVHESVELIRTLGLPRAAGFVNAVLRSLARQLASPPLPPDPGPAADRAVQLAYLTTSLSHPAWLAGRWLDRHGFAAARDWCAFNLRSPDVTARVASPPGAEAVVAAARAAGLDAAPARWVRGAVRLGPGVLGRLPAGLQRAVTVQDEGAQIVAWTAGVRPGHGVLDACASPGGKTLILAEALAGRGRLVAADCRPARVRLLAATLRQAAAPALIVRCDASRALPFAQIFDRVLLDAPCTGLGTVRRDPDVKWARTDADLLRFRAVQREMIARTSAVVRPGGALIYTTCSSEPEENDQVVEAFLAAHPAFRLEPAVPGPAVPEGAALVDARGFLRTLPFRDGLDAFFAAVLVRQRAA